MLCLELPEQLEQRLDVLAKATGRTKTDHVREAILAHLEDLEDGYTTEVAYSQFKASGEKGIPLEELMKEYDIEPIPNDLTLQTIQNSKSGRYVYRAKDADDLFKQLGI